MISPSGFDMTEDFKKSIYELLEQSKVEKELNKVKKSKPSTPKMKTQSLIRAKRIGRNKYKYDIGSYEDFERMMDEGNEIEKHSIKQILKDVIENIRDGVRMDDDYYDYDRNGFIKMLNKMDGERLELVYPTDIQTITTLIIQLSRFGELKYYDDVDGEDLRKKYRIEE